MKKYTCICLIVIILLFLFCGCADTSKDNKTITIVTTVFPEYDWTRQILGDTLSQVKLILLTDNGTDLHSYQPTIADMATIASCDILICTGGTSDTWLGDALSTSPSKGRTVLSLMNLLSDEEKLVEQSRHHNTEHSHEQPYDEHVWLSLKLAQRFCHAIRDALSTAMPENAETYEKNCRNYVAQLQALDNAYTSVVDRAELKTLLFADRFPFSYLAQDYGLECYAAFPGCSAETEASFQTITFLAEKVDTLELPAVIILESANEKIAKTVLETAKSKQSVIVTMDSLQSVANVDIHNGTTYLSIMTKNLSALKTALGQ